MDDGAFSALDRSLTSFHAFLTKHRLIVSLAAVSAYAAAVLLLGNYLGVSANYLVILPVLAISVCYGALGGFLGGLAALPANLLLFRILGHDEYSPASKLIAELSGVVVGGSFGYLSDYYRKLKLEIARRVDTEAMLRRALEEKELLLNEVHHRVKNNLNIIKSLVSLQAERSSEPGFKREAKLLIDRIFSISLVQELLYSRHSLDSIDLKDYLGTLAQNVVSGFDSGELLLDARIDPVPGPASMDAAVPLGLIVNEVLTNSMKHALEEGKTPRVSLDLAVEGNDCVLSIADNGPGFDRAAAAASGGLGIRLIETLARHLGGSYRYSFEAGTRFELVFPFPGQGGQDETHKAERRIAERRRVPL